MYIIALNSEKDFYFVSTQDQRQNLEARGISVLDGSFEKLTAAAVVVKELNNRKPQLLGERVLRACRA
ncbi:MAG: hypothetical protein GX075_13185 [Firmicutes bacterium]|nr:hypothetical protein [Bacillota bacterium]